MSDRRYVDFRPVNRIYIALSKCWKLSTCHAQLREEQNGFMDIILIITKTNMTT